METVLLSVNPKHVANIFSGKKTIELRKTRPRYNAPFKCYIYCTKEYCGFYTEPPYKEFWYGIDENETCESIIKYNPELIRIDSKVIGEFVCDKVTETIFINKQPKKTHYQPDITVLACLTESELFDYGLGKTLYGWHISDLKIYDKPKTLSEFGITRAPQSWCYVD